MWRKKILSFLHTPYPLTAFLDGDTCFCGPGQRPFPLPSTLSLLQPSPPLPAHCISGLRHVLLCGRSASPPQYIQFIVYMYI
jgi:hypothetical protein